MIKKIALAMMISVSLAFSASLKTGDSIKPFSLKDQFDKTVNVNSADYKTIVVAFEKDTAGWMNTYLKDKSNSYLSDNNTLFVSDISGMPSIITKLFAMPKFKKYNYSLALIKEESDLFPKQEESLTVLKLQDNKIVQIQFITNEEGVKGIF